MINELDLSPGIHHFNHGASTIAYSVWEADNSILLGSLRTKNAEKRKGHARAAMTEFLRLADKTGMDIDLGASPLTKDTRLGKIVAFYQSLGFELTGAKINAAGDPQMIRRAIREVESEPALTLPNLKNDLSLNSF